MDEEFSSGAILQPAPAPVHAILYGTYKVLHEAVQHPHPPSDRPSKSGSCDKVGPGYGGERKNRGEKSRAQSAYPHTQTNAKAHPSPHPTHAHQPA